MCAWVCVGVGYVEICICKEYAHEYLTMMNWIQELLAMPTMLTPGVAWTYHDPSHQTYQTTKGVGGDSNESFMGFLYCEWVYPQIIQN